MPKELAQDASVGERTRPGAFSSEKGTDAMRHLLALVVLLGLVLVSSGCRHVAGACDCDHASDCGAISGVKPAPAGPAALLPKPEGK